jgi:hypothetical protein
MLTQKLLRLDEAMIQEVEELAQELSKVEYTSFSSLVRKLITTGLNMKKIEKIIKRQEEEIGRLETALEIAVEALRKIAIKNEEDEEELEEVLCEVESETHPLYRAHLKSEEGLSSPARDEAEVLYVIARHRHGTHVNQYLTIESIGSHGVESVCISWVDDIAGASEWFFDKVGNKQVFLKKLTKRGWVLDGGWCVGFDTAEYLVQKFGGVIVPVLRHRTY